MLLLQGDCLEIMKTLPDKSIDLFLETQQKGNRYRNE